MRQRSLGYQWNPGVVAAWVLSTLLVGVTLLPQGAAQAQDIEWPEISVVEVVDGLDSPLLVTHAGDGSGRIFIVEQGGTIRVVQGGALLPTPFLDITNLVSCCGEQGLLGLAFPPDYSEKDYFYVNYTDNSGDTVVARYDVSANPNVADSDSEEVVLTVDQPYSNHNGGHLAFGPDGYLYIGLGDGGSGGDPDNNAQDPTTLLGKMLRIDVEAGVVPYAIPADNPFVGDPTTLDEIWALGLRNPWRYSFDRVTGDLYIGDVGQTELEEIDFQAASSDGGENYGWRCYEGTEPYNLAGCEVPSEYTFPVEEYSHNLGCAVTGGYVYRGEQYPRIDGVYFYGDYCSGRIWGLQESGTGWESLELLDTSLFISSFGEDEAGNLFLTDLVGGAVYEVVDSVAEETVVVTAITLKAKAVGDDYRVRGTVVVKDGDNTAVAGATVSVTWDLPDGTTLSQTATTNGRGRANFSATDGEGTYTLTVTDIDASGYVFDPDNSVLMKSITVP